LGVATDRGNFKQAALAQCTAELTGRRWYKWAVPAIGDNLQERKPKKKALAAPETGPIGSGSKISAKRNGEHKRRSTTGSC